ncbi:MAG TPA: MFS transporter [Streptosporangiaceae bacterium]|nr:MFS transporter [Streptosporangiaceae bacterium]
MVSAFGDSALWLAMGIWIKLLTGSSSLAGLSFLALALGAFAGPLSGWVVDRTRRRPLLIVTNAATMPLVLLLLLVDRGSQVWLVYVVVVAYGASSSLIGPAQVALTQTVVPSSLLGDANSVMQTAQQGFRLIAPLAGAGLLAAFGARPVIIGDAATFMVAIATLAAVKVSETKPLPSGERWRREVTAGIRYLLRTARLRQLVITAALVVTSYGISESLLYALTDHGFHKPATYVGLLTSAQGLGAIIAGPLAPAIMRRLNEATLACLGMASATAGYALLILHQIPLALVGSALLGVSIAWIIVGIITLLQRSTPPDLMGRTSAAFSFAYSVPQTLAIALGASLVDMLNYQVLLVIVLSIMVLGAAYLLTRPEQSLSVKKAAASAAMVAGDGAEANRVSNVAAPRLASSPSPARTPASAPAPVPDTAAYATPTSRHNGPIDNPSHAR